MFVTEAQSHRLSATLNGEPVSSLIAEDRRPLAAHRAASASSRFAGAMQQCPHS
jgi:hypothetical protein